MSTLESQQRGQASPKSYDTIPGGHRDPNVARGNNNQDSQRRLAPLTLSASDIVDWDGPDDLQNPLNWPRAKKWRNISLVASMALLMPFASTIFAPAAPLALQEFHSTNTTLGILAISIFTLGFAFGPMAQSPLSEAFGRKPLYDSCNFLALIFTVACATSTSLNMLIVFRFLAGCAGAAPLALGGATIADMFHPAERGKAMAVWSFGPMIGPTLGPIVGGYISQAHGWRWAFWFLTIVSGVISICSLLLLHETYAIILIERKVKRLRKDTNNKSLRSMYAQGLSMKDTFKRAVIRPIKFLYASPMVLLLSIHISVLFGTLFLLITTIPFVFGQQYRFKPISIGLVYLGMGTGLIAGLIVIGQTSDGIYKRLSARSGGYGKPEYRLPSLMYSGPFAPASLFLYGWSAQRGAHWIVPIIGTGFYGPAMIGALISVNTYVVEAYTRYAASAIAATTIFRCIFGAFLPLAGPHLYAKLGLGWGNSVLGFIALTLVPMSFLFFAFGERMRNKYPISL